LSKTTKLTDRPAVEINAEQAANIARYIEEDDYPWDKAPKDKWYFVEIDERGKIISDDGKVKVLKNNVDEGLSFNIQCVRDSESFKEKIQIETVLGGKWNRGSKTGHNTDDPPRVTECVAFKEIEPHFDNLDVYGIFLKHSRVLEIINLIRKYYENLNVISDEADGFGIPENIFNNILVMIKNHLDDYNKLDETGRKNTRLLEEDGKFYIPLAEFKSLLNDIDYAGVSESALRQKLSKYNIIETHNTESSVVKRKGQDVYRGLAFYTDKLKNYISNNETQK
jgi:hypothetical protein